MTSREQFEAEYSATRGTPIGVLKVLRAGDVYKDTGGGRLSIAWWAWQASREAVEVELPEPHAHVIWVQAGNAPDDYWDDVEISRSEQDKCCDGSERYPVYARHEVVSMLDSAGIKVKGE